MKKNSLELTVGLFVLIGLICLGYLTIKLGKMEFFASKGYNISAIFDSVSGLKTGAGVEIAGVQVGRVTSISLNSQYAALVTMLINENVKLSEDSIASVKTSGLIGDKYISISLGGSNVMLPDNGTITETEPALDIENLISKYVFGGVK